MDSFVGTIKEDQQLKLPPGFRFHPTDEELISHYLCKKVVDNNFLAVAIAEVDMNKVEPWDLPWKGKMGEREWYFFCVRDKKYPTGTRTNRATSAGYWKATGKDREIFRGGKSLIGMKKTLVFYIGRAPKGEKTNWVIHEYRLEGRSSLQNLHKASKNDWVICRVFQKSSGGKKVHMRLNPTGNELPPLTGSVSESSHVHCFSNDSPFTSNPIAWNQTVQPQPSVLLNPGAFPMQEAAVIRSLNKNYGQVMLQNMKKEKEIGSVSQETGVITDMNTEISSVLSNLEMGMKRSFEDQEASASAIAAQYLDYFWNY